MLLPSEGETPERTSSQELEYRYTLQVMNSALDLNLGSLGSRISFTTALPTCVFWPHSFSFAKQYSSFSTSLPCTHSMKSLVRSKSHFPSSQVLALRQMLEDIHSASGTTSSPVVTKHGCLTTGALQVPLLQSAYASLKVRSVSCLCPEQGEGVYFFLLQEVSFKQSSVGCLGGTVVECLPSAQGMIPGFWDQVPHQAPHREPASLSTYVSASLCVSLMSK